MLLDYKEARMKYGRVEINEQKHSIGYQHRRRNEERITCSISILHDSNRNEEWAKAIKNIIGVYTEP